MDGWIDGWMDGWMDGYIDTYIYTYTCNRIEQCALPFTTIVALWQLVNLGTRCMVTYCRIALWSHQNTQAASSEQCINANGEHLSGTLCLIHKIAQQNISGA